MSKLIGCMGKGRHQNTLAANMNERQKLVRQIRPANVSFWVANPRLHRQAVPVDFMNLTHAPEQPDWLDRALFPFARRFVDVGGNSIYSIAKGSRPTLLLLHGYPTGSFLGGIS